MLTINGQNELTVSAEAGNVYCIVYETSTAVDICNNTEGNIFVNSTGEFTQSENVGNYLTIPDGGAYNGYRSAYSISSKVYIKAEAAGNICITVKGW